MHPVVARISMLIDEQLRLLKRSSKRTTEIEDYLISLQTYIRTEVVDLEKATAKVDKTRMQCLLGWLKDERDKARATYNKQNVENTLLLAELEGRVNALKVVIDRTESLYREVY